MSTIQTTRPTPPRWVGIALATVGALTAITVVLFLALAGESRGHHPAISHPAPTYYPLIRYRGTGAAPASMAGRPATTPAPVSSRKPEAIAP